MSGPRSDFELELRELRGHLLAMGARCERAVNESVTAFARRDRAMAERVFELDRRIDRDEMEIDELTIGMIAVRQPVAEDLRFLAATLKFVTDLERIGDEAVNIAERARDTASDDKRPQVGEIERMGAIAQAMLRASLDAFVDGDAASARRVLAKDDEVDALYGQTLRALFAWMAEHPESIASAQAVVSVARYLERVADHATNLAEQVVFMIEGRDVRHGGARGA
ncbi:MAG: phosphate signaling complex protein PhoU [Myxococcales bacterium]|nr:phosphate signaling complex protein PhoU [Myxococcales bacterium]